MPAVRFFRSTPLPAILAFLPAVVTLSLWARWAIVWPLIVGCLLLGASVWAFRRSDGVGLVKGGTPWALLLGFPVLGWIFSLGPAMGTESVTKWAAAGALGWLAAATWTDRHRRWFWLSVVGTAFVYGGLVFAGRIFPSVLGDILPRNPQYRAFWLTLAYGASLWRIVPAHRPAGDRIFSRGAIFWIFSGMFFLAALLLYRSRSGVVAAAVGTGLWLLYRFKGRGLGLGIALALAVAVLAPTESLHSLLKSGDDFGWSRFAIWGTSLAAMAERPWSGWGPGLFSWAYEAHRRPIPIDGIRFDHHYGFAHNDFLQVGVEYGIPALGCLIFALASHLRRAWRESRPGDAAVGGMAAVFCLFNFPFFSPGNALLAGALLAATSRNAGKTTGGPPRPSRALGRLSALALAGMGAANLLLFFQLIAAAPLPLRVFSRAQIDAGLGRADHLMHHAGADTEDYKGAQAVLESLRRDCPRHPQVSRDEAHLIVDHFTPPLLDDASERMSQALSLSRTSAEWWLEWAVIDDRRGAFESAVIAVDRALALEPAFAAARLLKARLLRRQGKPLAAVALLRRLAAEPAPPDNVSSYVRALRQTDPTTVRSEWAYTLIEAGRTTEALDVLATIPDPRSEPVLVLRVLAFKRAGDSAQTQKALQALRHQFPGHPLAAGPASPVLKK